MGQMIIAPAISGRFPTINLTPGEFPQQIRGRVGGILPVTFTWNTPAFRARLPEFLAIEATRISGGSPQRTLSGVGVAIADGGHLVTLTVTEGPHTLTATGIISVPGASLGPGGPGVTSVSVIFYECSELHYYGGASPEVVL